MQRKPLLWFGASLLGGHSGQHTNKKQTSFTFLALGTGRPGIRTRHLWAHIVRPVAAVSRFFIVIRISCRLDALCAKQEWSGIHVIKFGALPICFANNCVSRLTICFRCTWRWFDTGGGEVSGSSEAALKSPGCCVDAARLCFEPCHRLIVIV